MSDYEQYISDASALLSNKQLGRRFDFIEGMQTIPILLMVLATNCDHGVDGV